MSGRARPAQRTNGTARRRERGVWPIWAGIAVVIGLAVGLLVANGTFDKAINSLTLPLDHEDIIRQQPMKRGSTRR